MGLLTRPESPVESRDLRISKMNQVFELNRERLIRVFIYYCSFGEPLNTNTMRSAKFIKFLKDAGLLKEDEIPGVKKRRDSATRKLQKRAGSAMNTNREVRENGISKVQADLLFKKHTGLKVGKANSKNMSNSSSSFNLLKEK